MKQHYTFDCQCGHGACILCGKRRYKLKKFDRIRLEPIKNYLIEHIKFYIYDIQIGNKTIILRISKFFTSERRSCDAFRCIRLELAYIDTYQEDIGRAVCIKETEIGFSSIFVGDHHQELRGRLSYLNRTENLSVVVRILNNCYFSFHDLIPNKSLPYPNIAIKACEVLKF